jgi:hypothetical protein
MMLVYTFCYQRQLCQVRHQYLLPFQYYSPFFSPFPASAVSTSTVSFTIELKL